MKCWNLKKTGDPKVMELDVSGDITMEQDILDWLMDKPDRSATAFEQAVRAAAGKDIILWINSNGGDMAAASVMYSVLKEHDGKITAKVNSALSAASVVAMAADEVLMSPTGLMMIHDPWTYAEGGADEMKAAIDVLEQCKEGIINAYVLKTGMTRDEISRMMSAETWMSAEKAVELGFADGVLYGDEAEKPDEKDAKALISGARAVYAAIPREKYAEKLKEALREMEAEKAEKTDGKAAAEAKIRLEKARF